MDEGACAQRCEQHFSMPEIPACFSGRLGDCVPHQCRLPAVGRDPGYGYVVGARCCHWLQNLCCPICLVWWCMDHVI